VRPILEAMLLNKKQNEAAVFENTSKAKGRGKENQKNRFEKLLFVIFFLQYFLLIFYFHFKGFDSESCSK